MGAKGTQTRENIIRQSLQLFSSTGYSSTSINDILRETELTKGGLYGHFRSKEDIWYAVYDQAVSVWKEIVFAGTRDIADPLERIERVVENNMRDYLGGDTFEGGCFFVNMLVELSGRSGSMRRHILRGFVRFSRLLRSWLEEAEAKGFLRPGLNFMEISNFLVISFNGAATLYRSSRDSVIWSQTIKQLKFYIDQLRQPAIMSAQGDTGGSWVVPRKSRIE